ncbi:hypothetical protein [Pseudomonas sp. IPO3778]|uniref:hypothetical protein n=1 Tax=unclassified Pseudomonas TaxID=196821 RepID=UPI0035BF6447
MKSLLYPAVAFMNRLTFGMKFSLISVLFLLPMLATNYYLVRDSWREFQGTRIELQSLDLLGSSLALRRDLETLNNQVQINATLGQSGKAGDIESTITALEQSLLQRLQGLQALSADPEQAAAFDAKRDELIAAFKAQQQETSLLSKSALIGKLLNKAQMLSQIIARPIRPEPRPPRRPAPTQRTDHQRHPASHPDPGRRPGHGRLLLGPRLSQLVVQHPF